MLQKPIQYFKTQPSKLFLLDSIGATITFISIFFVLRPNAEFIGLPAPTMTYLALIGLVFCFYSAICSSFLKRNQSLYLRIIALANGIYCALTLGMMSIYSDTLTLFGFAYFLGEIMIIFGIIYLEWKVASQLITQVL